MLSTVIAMLCLLGDAQPAPAKKLTVADVIAAFKLDEMKFSYRDEPPGKLRAISTEIVLAGTKQKMEVRIDLRYTHALFSVQRGWDIRTVRDAEVSRVTLTPISTEE